MIWLPCPKCGDDNTFVARICPARRCRCCGWMIAVVATPLGHRAVSAKPGGNHYRNRLRTEPARGCWSTGKQKNTEVIEGGRSVKRRRHRRRRRR